MFVVPVGWRQWPAAVQFLDKPGRPFFGSCRQGPWTCGRIRLLNPGSKATGFMVGAAPMGKVVVVPDAKWADRTST